MLGGPVGGYFLGHWLDNWLDTSPYLMIIGAVFGLITSIRETIKILGQLSKESDDHDPDDF
jgi:F0F1-type ATP synthase assembly protein I